MHKLWIVSQLLIILCFCGCEEEAWDPADNGPRVREPLIIAARDGNLPALQKLIDDGGDVNKKSRNGYGALSYAVENEHVEVVELLVKHGANPNVVDRWGTPPLLDAARNGNAKIVKLLLEAGANVNATGKNTTGTAIEIAAHHGHSEVGLVLKESGAPVTFMTACGINDIDVVRAALDKNPGLANSVTQDWSPMVVAATHGFEDLILLLLDRGADPNQFPATGLPPLLEAVRNEHRGIAKVLLEKGADPNGRGMGTDLAPLHVAAEKNDLEIAILLLQHGAAPDLTDNIGNTPMMLSLLRQHDNPDFVKSLLDAGADREKKNSFGNTALDYAKKYEATKVLNLLTESNEQ